MKMWILFGMVLVCVGAGVSSQCERIENSLYCRTIPHDLPAGVDRVYLQDEGHLHPLNKGHFTGINWKNVRLLSLLKTPGNQTDDYIGDIGPYAMEGLDNLDQLFVISDTISTLHKNSLVGIERLKLLNFTGCPNLDFQQIVSAVNGNNTLPSLEVFSVTYTSAGNGIELEKNFFDAIATKPIKMLDFHDIDFTSMQLRFAIGIQDTLKIVNISGVTLDKFDLTGMNITKVVKSPKLLDLSHVILPKWMLWFVIHLPSLLKHSFTLDMTHTKLMSNFETIDVTGINSVGEGIRFSNFTFFLKNTPQGKANWRSRHIRTRHNNLQYLDVIIPCNFSTIQKIDFSYNNMEFLRPDLCPCCSNLQDLNLSNNKLFLMAKRNFTIFKELLNYLPNLRVIDLSSNNLTVLPKAFFVSSKKLQTIDLSGNHLQKVNVTFQNLAYIRRLNLRNNKITILDSTSIINLQALTNLSFKHKSISEIVDLRNNPILCDTCDTLESIAWLAEHFGQVQLKCLNNEGHITSIDQRTSLYVKHLCEKPIRLRNTILLSTLISATIITVSVFISCKVMKCRKQLRYKRDMEERVRLIQENEMEIEYVAFLCFSSYDYEFVNTNVYEPLHEHLQEITGTERELVCVGDRNFQIGKPINDEIVRSIHNSAVVLLVVSNHFCESEYCRMEFDQAMMMNKPFVVMMKEDVNEDNMAPALRELFKNRTRILWERDGEVYQLKTTWDNVCTSILELVQD